MESTKDSMICEVAEIIIFYLYPCNLHSVKRILSKSEKEIFGRDFFFQCVSFFDKEWDMLSVSLLCRTTQQQQPLSLRMLLISIPPPPPLISLGHLEKVERGRQRERKSEVFAGAGEVHRVRQPLLLWYANKPPGRHRNGDGRAAGRAQKQTTLSGIFEGSAGKMRLSSSLQTRVHRLPLLSAGSPAVRKRTEAFSLLFDYLCPLLCGGGAAAVSWPP